MSDGVGRSEGTKEELEGSCIELLGRAGVK